MMMMMMMKINGDKNDKGFFFNLRRINSGKINPSLDSNDAPQELPRVDFPNFTLLSCTDLSLATKKSKGSFGPPEHPPHRPHPTKSHSESENQKTNTSKFSSGVFQATSAGNSRIKTETSGPTPLRQNPTRNVYFSDDSTDLLFEEAMMANGIDEPRPHVHSGEIQNPSKRRTGAPAGGSTDDLPFLADDDDDDLVFEVGAENSRPAVRNDAVGRPPWPKVTGAGSDEDLLMADMEEDLLEVINFN